jgi:hypothetical protein
MVFEQRMIHPTVVRIKLIFIPHGFILERVENVASTL